MKLKFFRCLMALLLPLVMSAGAWAASGPFACKPSTPAYSAVYSPFTGTNNVTAVTFDVSCTRTAPFGAASMLFNVKSFNGLNGGGTPPTNRALLTGTSATFLPYDLFKDSTCSTPWKNTTYISNTLVMPSGQASATSPALTFYVCIPAGQTTTIAGTSPYTDSVKLQIVNVTMTPAGTVETDVTSQVGVTITVPKECSVIIPPGFTVDFGSYTAFGGLKTTSASFNAKCTNTAAYTMAITDSNGAALTNGVVAGLNYSLALSASGGTGNGTNQAFAINGTMPAGQAGSCSGGCSGPKTNTSHYLTITY